MQAPRPYGIDGCRAGWLTVACAPRNSQLPRAEIYESLEEFVSKELLGDLQAVVAIDVPIGLPSSNCPVRECDRLARECLKSRHVCVFSPPCQEALRIKKHKDASAKNSKILNRGLSLQAHAISAKIAETNSWLLENRERRQFWHEVHPEVSFAHWNGSLVQKICPLPSRKKMADGKRDRARLIEGCWPGAIAPARAKLGIMKDRWAMDDLHDAFACLWTAQRISRNEAVSYPLDIPIPTDSKGLPMQIVA